MRERADRDDIAFCSGSSCQRCFIDATGCFNDGAVIDDCNSFAHELRCHVIEHDDVCAAGVFT